MRFVIAATLTVFAVHLCAQTPAAVFEAASVKPSAGGQGPFAGGTRGFGVSLLTGDSVGVAAEHISISNEPLRRVIEVAYGIAMAQRYLLQDGPANLLLERYDIAATVRKGATGKDVMEMFRTLLADRFNLRIHKEAREMPVYVVTVARSGRLGPALTPSDTDCVTFAAARAANPALVEPLDRKGRPLCSHSDGSNPMTIGSASSIASLLIRMQGFVDRPMIDETGLTGVFEWELAFSPDDRPQATAPLIRDAFQDQLGLKLDPSRRPVDVFVIDHIERPSEN